MRAALLLLIVAALPTTAGAAIIQVVKSEIEATAIAGIDYFNAEYSSSYTGSTSGFRGLREEISADIRFGDPDVYTGASNAFQFSLGATSNLRFNEYSPQNIDLQVHPMRYWLDGPSDDPATAIWNSTYARIDMVLVHRFRLREGSVTGNLMDLGRLGSEVIFNESAVSLRDLTSKQNLSAFGGHTFQEDHLYEARVNVSALCTGCVDDFEADFILRMNSQDPFSVEVPGPAPLWLFIVSLAIISLRRLRQRSEASSPQKTGKR